MTRTNRPLATDIAAREAIEKAELALARRDGTLALDACAMLAELARAGYRLTALADPSSIEARPVRMRARYDGYCGTCGDELRTNDPIVWTRGAQGVECVRCGAAP